MNHVLSAESKGIRIRPLMERDIESLRNWRNDKENAMYLNRIPYVTIDLQHKWYKNYCGNENEITFAIEHYGEMVGSVSIYNFADNTFEYGKIMIGEKKKRGLGIGYKSVVLAMHIGFAIGKYRECLCSVHENNEPGMVLEKRIGFTEYNRHRFESGGYEFEMKIAREDFYEKNEWVKDVLIVRYDNDGD